MVSISSISSALAFFALTATSVQAATLTCTIKGGSSDDASAIVSAFNSCKNGGTVVFSKGTTYNLNSLIDISGINNVNVQFYGTVNLPGYNKFVGENTYFKIKGSNIYWDGNGVGNFVGGGQAWYDAANNKAPTVLRISATHSTFRNFKITNAPRAHLGVTSANDLVLEKITLNTQSSSSKLPKNTDALDISSSQNIIVRDSSFTVGDDCMAVNGGVTNVTVSNVNCVNGHGFSVGSLGKDGATETVKQITVTGSTCTNCQNGIRIKTWPGGKGSVSDIHFEHVKLVNTQNPVLITTHYCDNNQLQYCNSNDKQSLSISDVVINDITGSISSATKNPVININCSSGTPCSGFSITGVNVSKNSNTPKNVCTYLTGSDKISYCQQ